MPLIMRCDAPACGKEVQAAVSAAGRVSAMQGDGWWYVRSDGKGVCACSVPHFASAQEGPACK